jgi:hypothetical protein
MWRWRGEYRFFSTKGMRHANDLYRISFNENADSDHLRERTTSEKIFDERHMHIRSVILTCSFLSLHIIIFSREDAEGEKTA